MKNKGNKMLVLSDLIRLGEMGRKGMSTLGKYKWVGTCRLTYPLFLLEVREALR